MCGCSLFLLHDGPAVPACSAVTCTHQGSPVAIVSCLLASTGTYFSQVSTRLPGRSFLLWIGFTSFSAVILLALTAVYLHRQTGNNIQGTQKEWLVAGRGWQAAEGRGRQRLNSGARQANIQCGCCVHQLRAEHAAQLPTAPWLSAAQSWRT